MNVDELIKEILEIIRVEPDVYVKYQLVQAHNCLVNIKLYQQANANSHPSLPL